ncbi:MAG: outer membrane beta-barrel protein [Hyphomicrobiales bacterium]|nr:outer membrane beta-barrel protein [Hyphomicrobiales bacterium]
MRSHAGLVATALLLLFADVAAAQTLWLRGRLDDKAQGGETVDSPRRAAAAANRIDLNDETLGLAEPKPAASTADPASSTDPASTDAAAADLTRIAPAKPSARAPSRRGRVTPVAPAQPPASGGPTLPVAATEPTPRALDTATAEEAEKPDDAYAPLGLRTGGMIWYPALEASAGRKSNVDSTRGGRASALWTVEPELVGRSDWSRHSLEVTLRGGRSAYPDAADQSQNRWSGEMRGRIDLGDLTRADIVAGWSRQRESSSANEASTSGAGTDRETKTASLGVTRDVGLVALTLRGGYERNGYLANGALAAGATDPAVQNNDLWTVALRATLGPTHTIAPFVEVQGSARRYDAGSVYGHVRDGEGSAIRVGVAADAGPTLRGEIATGWGTERPHDRALNEMTGWLVDGNLTWSPSRLVVVKTKVKSTFEPTTNAGSPGALTRAASIDLDWALRRDVTVSFGVGLDGKHYYGIDVDEQTASLSAGLTYKFDRNFQTFLRTRFDRVTASNAEAYDVATVTAGVRIQR